jgi:hypothetical protein
MFVCRLEVTMEMQTKPGVRTSSQPEWLAPFAEANGFLLDALDENRARRYSDAQVQVLEQRGRSELRRGLRPAWAALAISLAGFFSALFISSPCHPQIPGVVTSPQPWAGTSAKWISFALLCIGLLVARSEYRYWRELRTELREHRICKLKGPVTSRSDFPWEGSPGANTFYYYELWGASFQIDQKAFAAFQELPPNSQFQAYYVPSRMWLVNMEPI